MRGVAAWGVLAAGCTCQEPPVSVIDAPHYVGWEAVVDAVARGDRRDATERSRMMTEGQPSLWSGDAADDANTRVGAGLGFIGMSEDADELAQGLAAAASGCGECHRAAGVVPEGKRPVLSHGTGAQWVAWGLVWHDFRTPVIEDPILQPMITAWGEPAPSDTDAEPPEVVQAARWFSSCSGCHSTTQTLESP